MARRLHLVLAALVLAALAASACSSPKPPAPGSDAEKIAQARAAGFVCRSLPTPGSHKLTTVCAKPADWTLFDEQQRQMAEAARDQSDRAVQDSMNRMNNGMH